ncbi:MAG: alpha/beta hydrolase, partial [Caldilineaceae bacterium]|nr:alpha/beta hydrolase [Caldilineaceae bacterium]
GPGSPVHVFVHGGYWRRFSARDFAWVAEPLVATGVTAVIVNYALCPTVSLTEIVRQTRAAIAWCHLEIGRFGGDPARLTLSGHSAGGHLALWLAARHRLPAPSPLFTRDPQPIAGVVALAGIPDLVGAARQAICGDAVIRLLGGEPETHPDRYAQASPAALAPLGVPHVHIVGDRDHVIPLAYAEESVAAAAGAGDQAELLLLANCGHFEVVHPFSAIWPLVMRAILTTAGLTVK